jgi:septation ring formation regulator EzrA
MQMQQDLRRTHNTVEELQDGLSSTQAELEQRIDAIERSLSATAKHLQLPAAIMEGLELLIAQSETVGKQLNELQQTQSDTLEKEIAEQRDAMAQELSELQAQLENCQQAAGGLLIA